MDIFRSQCHRDMGVGSFDSGRKQQIRIHHRHCPSHALATTVDHPSNPNPKRHIFNLNVIETWGCLYHSYWQATFGVLSLATAKPLPNNHTEYPSNHLARPISLHQNIVQTWELVLLTHDREPDFNMLVMLAVNSYMLIVIS